MANQRIETSVFIGPMGSGKTQIIRGLTEGRFLDPAKPTMGVDLKSIKGQNATLKIWDTAGQDRFKSLILGYANTAEHIFIVLDCTLSEKQTDDFISTYWKIAQANKRTDAKIHFIFNKTDLKDQRQITEESAKQKIQALPNYNHENIIFYSAKGAVDKNVTLPVFNKNLVKNPIIQTICPGFELKKANSVESPQKTPHRPWTEPFWRVYHAKRQLPTREKIVTAIKFLLIFALITALSMGIGGSIGYFAGAWVNPAQFFAALSGLFQGAIGPWALGIMIAAPIVSLIVTAAIAFACQKKKKSVETLPTENASQDIKNTDRPGVLEQGSATINNPTPPGKPLAKLGNNFIWHEGGRVITTDEQTGEVTYDGPICVQQ